MHPLAIRFTHGTSLDISYGPTTRVAGVSRTPFDNVWLSANVEVYPDPESGHGFVFRTTARTKDSGEFFSSYGHQSTRPEAHRLAIAAMTRWASSVARERKRYQERTLAALEESLRAGVADADGFLDVNYLSVPRSRWLR